MNKKMAVITGAVGTVLTAVLTVKHIKNTSYADGYKAGASDSMEYAETVMTGFCEDIKAVTKPVFDRHNALIDKYNDLVDEYEKLHEEYSKLLEDKD